MGNSLRHFLARKRMATFIPGFALRLLLKAFPLLNRVTWTSFGEFSELPVSGKQLLTINAIPVLIIDDVRQHNETTLNDLPSFPRAYHDVDDD